MKRNFTKSMLLYFFIAYAIGTVFVLLGLITGLGVLYFVAASSASLAGILTAWIVDGKPGVIQLLGQLKRWKSNVTIYLMALGIPLVSVLIGLLVHMITGHPLPELPIRNFLLFPLYLVVFTIQAGFGEEIGWRGFATPRLAERYPQVIAALIVGVGWAIWHLPLFFIPNFQWKMLADEYGFWNIYLGFAVFVIMCSVVYTWLYVKGHGNIWIPIIMHGTFNTLGVVFEYQNSRLYGNLTVFLTSSAVIVVLGIIVALASPIMKKRPIP